MVLCAKSPYRNDAAAAVVYDELTCITDQADEFCLERFESQNLSEEDYLIVIKSSTKKEIKTLRIS